VGTVCILSSAPTVLVVERVSNDVAEGEEAVLAFMSIVMVFEVCSAGLVLLCFCVLICTVFASKVSSSVKLLLPPVPLDSVPLSTVEIWVVDICPVII